MTTETGMVERCARALAGNGIDLDSFVGQTYVELVKTVLQALRIPTPEMVEAGLRALQDNLGHSSVIIRDADACFSAMIDAASPSKGEPSDRRPNSTT